MTRYYNYDELDSVEHPENIEQLYQLRHYLNVTEDYAGLIAEGFAHAVIEKLRYSSLRGSTDIQGFVGCDDNTSFSMLENMLTEHREAENSKRIAKLKNMQLVHQLANSRNTFCGLGTNKIKRRLNKLALNNPIAHAIRIALQAEDHNITAKKQPVAFKDKSYAKKEESLRQLVNVFAAQGWEYGKQSTDVPPADYVLYFDIPGCEQLSWHVRDSYSNYLEWVDNHFRNAPDYGKEWDRKECATMSKLEQAIIDLFPEILHGKLKVA